MRASTKGLELIKRFEGLRTSAYLCPAGRWTIGYGHTATARKGQTISREQADELLRRDVGAVDAQINALCDLYGVRLRQSQHDALASFVFNLGIGALRGSTLWRKVRADPDDRSIAAEFNRWVYAGGKRLDGLVRRRAAEAVLYFNS